MFFGYFNQVYIMPHSKVNPSLSGPNKKKREDKKEKTNKKIITHTVTHTQQQKKEKKKEELCLHFPHPHKHTTQSRAHHNHNGTSNQPNFTLTRTNTPTADLHAEHGARSGKQLSQRSLRATGASTHCISFGATYAPRPATVHHLAPAARRFAGSIGGDFLRRSRVGAGGVTALTCVFCRCLGGHWLAGFGFDFEVGWIKFI